MTRKVTPRTLLIYLELSGEEPFSLWLESLSDSVQARIRQRLRRLEQGNLGDCKLLGDGVSELRLFFGPGYRIYFGEHQNSLVILLLGGDKSSQKKDIKKAKKLWENYKERFNEDVETL